MSARRRGMSAALAAALMLLAPSLHAQPVPAATDDAAGTGAREWRFEVRLDDDVVGEHRFTVRRDGDAVLVTSQARFDVRLLGIPVYRYRHEAQERWTGGCLVQLDAQTQVNGKDSRVAARRDGDTLRIDGPAGAQALPGCAMSFAYWNPALRRQSQLLNPQTGAVETVRFAALGTGEVEARGAPVRGDRWRLSGPESPIELWYGPGGDWLALDATAGGKRLRYRLR